MAYLSHMACLALLEGGASNYRSRCFVALHEMRSERMDAMTTEPMPIAEVTEEEARTLLSEILDTDLGFPHLVTLVDGKSSIGDAGGENAVARLAHRLTALADAERKLVEARRELDTLRDVLSPFVDLKAQNEAWGIISKKLDDLSPVKVTVTKAQMRAACSVFLAAQDGGKG